MKKGLLFFLLALSKFCFAQTTYLTQNFSSSAIVSDYVSATPNSGQFDAIGTSGAGTTISISGGKLQYVRTANAGSFSRTTDFSPTPTTLYIQFNFHVSSASTAQTTAAVFQVGSGFSGTLNAAEANANTYARIGINLVSGGGFSLRNIGTGTNSSNFTTEQQVSWALNNSGSTTSYNAPDGTYETLANDKADIWIGTTKAFNDIDVTTATQTMTDFKFAWETGIGTLTIDDILIRDIAGTLPVSLLSFKPRLNDDQTVRVDWATATEENSSHFVVERSQNAQVFTQIAQVDAAGNSQQLKNYLYTDLQPLAGTNYYRLVQVDKDGRSQTYRPASVVVEKLTALSVYPNPAEGSFVVNAPSEAKLSLQNLVGQVVLFSQQSIDNQQIMISATDVKEGIYILIVQTDAGTQQCKVIIR